MALPVLVVWIVSRTKTNSDNRRAEVLIKAIESNNAVDADKLAEALTDPKKRRKTPFEEQVGRLTGGCVCTFLGLALNIVCLVMYLSEGGGGDYGGFGRGRSPASVARAAPFEEIFGN